MESNITVLSFGTNTNDPLLVQLSDPKDFVVYFNAKPIYRFHTANTVRIYSWAIVPETLQELICLEYTDRHKKSNYALISSNGKLLLESEFPIICKYNQTFNQIDLSMSKVKKGVKYPVTYSGVYFPEKEQVAFVPFVPTNWRQTGTNTILYIDNYLNKEKNKLSTSYYFLDFSGNCISGEVYTEAIFYTVNNLKLIQLRQNNVPAIYNSDAQKLCDSCYFYPWNNNPEYYSPYVIVNKSINDITLEVTDEDLQPVLPGNYLAVYDMGNYFALLTKDHQIVYVETPFK